MKNTQTIVVQLFYDPKIIPGSKTHSFDKAESRHILKVLRKKPGDLLFITNGSGYLYDCEIRGQLGSICEVIIRKERFAPPNSTEVHLAVCPTKKTDRFEWLLEKATEIGLTSITPILTQRSERKILKIERLEKIVQSAMKQSLRTYLPKINETTRLIEFLSQDFKGNKLIAHCEKGTKTLLKEVVNPRKNTLILIGPEGDFSEDEIEMALANGFEPIHLGDHRLRTETAALLACTLTNAVYETF